jgi:hypothetical protein
MAKRRKRKRPSFSPTERIKTKTKKSDAILCFQDVWTEYCSSSLADDETADADVVSNVFFELANAPSVSYRLEAPQSPRSPAPIRSSKDEGENDKIDNSATEPTNDVDATTIKKTPASNTIVIQQDVLGAAQTHTGGIVWETSYLLLNYLLSSTEWLSACNTGTANASRTVLEIGAGCGMLGLSLHKAFELGIIGDSDKGSAFSSSRVVVTETNEVMDNLRKNFEQNYPLPSSEGSTTTTGWVTNLQAHRLSVEELDWTRCKEDCSRAKIEARSVDCIVGTDVVFSTRFVQPMLETMQFLSHPHTVIYLCLQERCKDSHKLLLGEATNYGFCVEDISEAVYNDEALAHSCGFGRTLECKLLKFTVVAVEEAGRNEKKISKKEKKKSKKEKNN